MNFGVTLYEMVLEEVPDVRFMHPFGCQASAIHHNDDLLKFSARGRPCVFIGYDTIRKAYKLLTMDDLSIIVRAPQDVTFNDHVFPVRENMMRNTLGTLFSNVGKDTDTNPHQDYTDFYVPNLILLDSGGARQMTLDQSLPFTPLLQICNFRSPVTPMDTPALQLPNSSPLTPEPEVIVIDSTPTTDPTDAHFEGESHTPAQNAPPFDQRPFQLQRVWGTTPTFFRSIPFNLSCL
jgi:hypothetical protein